MSAPHSHPVIKRGKPMPFEEWRAVVLQNGTKYLRPAVLAALYEEGWDAVACIEFLDDLGWYGVPKPERYVEQVKGYRRKVYNEAFARKRIGLAIWTECGRLLKKNLDGYARAFVTATKAEMDRHLIKPD